MLTKFDNQELPKIKTHLKENFNGYLAGLFKIQDLNENEKLLLQKLSLFPSIDISFSDLIDFLDISGNAKEDFDTTINQLHNKGWLISGQTNEENSFKLHQIIK